MSESGSKGRAGLWFKDSSVVERIVFYVAGFCILLSMYRYVTYRFTSREFVRDAQVWVSVGESVLQGQALYAGVADNKPPVWEGIAILASATPWPYLILLLIVGLTSALVVIQTVELAETFVSERAAVLAAILLGFGILQATNGFINNKTLALACLLWALLARREVVAGLGYALAVLVAQQIALAAPVVIWWEWQRGSDLRILTAVVIGVPVISYAVVGLVWGVDALVAGVRQTVFLAGDYATGTSQFQTNGSPLTNPGRYIELLNRRLRQFILIIAFAGVGVARIFSRPEDTPRVAWLALGLTVLLALPLGVRLYRHYWLLPLVGAILLAAYGIDWLLTIDDADTRLDS